MVVFHTVAPGSIPGMGNYLFTFFDPQPLILLSGTRVWARYYCSVLSPTSVLSEFWSKFAFFWAIQRSLIGEATG